MILVTGTQCAGAALWMQILRSAGFPSLNEAPPDGFEMPGPSLESTFKSGIYYATNPHPQTGRYVFPEQVERHVVHVSVPGLVRTDRAFIGRVLATIRRAREYVAAVERLEAIEAAGGRAPPRVPPILEWWAETYALVRDISLRRYAAHVEAYDRLLRDPERVIGEVLDWLGGGDRARAVQVAPKQPETEPGAPGGIEPELEALFDELYDTIDRRSPISGALIQKLNDAQRVLLPRINETARTRPSSDRS
jgi:hypothetical protein